MRSAVRTLVLFILLSSIITIAYYGRARGEGDIPGDRFSSLYDITWMAALGGSGSDAFIDAAFTAEGGALLIGEADSASEDARGKMDAWAVRLDPRGDAIWSRRYGGRGGDKFVAAHMMTNGDCLLLAETESVDGDVKLHRGEVDAWVLRVDAQGDIIWSKSLGGTLDDRLRTIVASGSTILLAGETNSYNHDLTSNHGGTDAWICAISLDSGKTLWSRSVGGTGDDRFLFIKADASNWQLLGEWAVDEGGATRIQPFIYTVDQDGNELGREVLSMKNDAWLLDVANSDTGLVLAGKSSADDSDGWVGTLSADGDFNEKYLENNTKSSIVRTLTYADGMIVALGELESTDSRLRGTHGGKDVWVLSIKQGDTQWEQALGGSGDESPLALMRRPDGRFIVATQSGSKDGDLESRHASSIIWLTLLDGNGNLKGKQKVSPFPDQTITRCVVGTRRELLLLGRATMMNGRTQAIAIKLTEAR